MFKLKVLNLCKFFQIKKKDELKCEDFVNNFSQQLEYVEEIFHFYDLVIFILIFVIIYFIIKKINIFS